MQMTENMIVKEEIGYGFQLQTLKTNYVTGSPCWLSDSFVSTAYFLAWLGLHADQLSPFLTPDLW